MGYGTKMIDKDFEPSGFIFFCGHHVYIIEDKHICKWSCNLKNV